MTQESTLPGLASGDDFALLQVPRRFSLDAQVLRQHYLAGLRASHPDRFAAAAAQQQRLAQQWSARLNEAYARLSDPVERAVYLCLCHGLDVRATGGNRYLPPDVLEQQMVWREQLEEMLDSADPTALAELREGVQVAYQRVLDALSCLWDRLDENSQDHPLPHKQRFVLNQVVDIHDRSMPDPTMLAELNQAAALTCELILIDQFLKRELKVWR